MTAEQVQLRAAAGERPAFTAAELERRAATAAAAMADRGIDLLLLFDPQSLTYFTGYTSMNMWDFSAVAIGPDGQVRAVLWEFERPRWDVSAGLGELFTYESHADSLAALGRMLDGLGHTRFAVDSWARGCTPDAWARVVELLGDGLPCDARPVLWATRLRKSEAELDLLRRAAAITDVGIEAAARAVAPGVADRDVAAAASAALLEAGSEQFAIAPVVAAGPRAGIPHSEAAGRAIEAGEGVFVELGASVGRYTAPVMRTVAAGEPEPGLASLAELAERTLAAAVERMRAGTPCSEVARAAHDVLDSAGRQILFHGFLGYPVGVGVPPSWIEALDFHVHLGNHEPLAAGTVLHVPLSLRERGSRGVGMSATLAVRADGGPELLTGSPARLIVAGPDGEGAA